MRTLRMEKLAGMRKVAEESAETSEQETITFTLTNDLPMDVEIKQSCKFGGNWTEFKKGYGFGGYTDCDNLLVRRKGSETQYTIRTDMIENAYNAAGGGMNPRIVLSALSEELYALIPREQPKDKASSRGRVQTSRAPANPLAIKHSQNTKLKDNTYLYEVTDPNNTFKWQLLSDKSKTGIFERSSVSVDKWNRAVNVLNSLAPISTPSAAPATTTEPATGAPAAEPPKPEAAVSGQAASFDPQMISNVSIILQKASSRAYAMTVPGNQKKQIKDMLRAIGVAATVAGISGVTNPSQFLANLIIAKRGPASFATIGKMQDVAALSRGDIKSAAKEEVRLLMEGVNEVYRIYGGNDYERMVRQFASVMRRGQAASAAQKEQVTQAPAATTASHLDPRIKKLAKLRRLRVRAQMEAAVEPSAKLGRSRIS
jgi:hypothetical protein